MELRHLRYFKAVSETLNFTAAARKLGIAQPPLSVQIRNLETELGTPLFDRSNRKVQLTAAGKIFLPEARDLLAQADRALLNLQDAVAGRLGEIVIRHTPSALSEQITRRLRKFIRKHRGVRILVESIDYQNITSYELPNYDACVHDILPAEETTTGIVLERSSIVIALRAKHRLAAHPEIVPTDLLGERILLAPAHLRSAAERHLAALIQNLAVTVASAPSNPFERLWHASLGLGITACSAADRFASDAILVPLAGPGSEVVTVVTSNPNSKAAGLPVLMEFIRE